jgi:hypothetical protein
VERGLDDLDPLPPAAEDVFDLRGACRAERPTSAGKPVRAAPKAIATLAASTAPIASMATPMSIAGIFLDPRKLTLK